MIAWVRSLFTRAPLPSEARCENCRYFDDYIEVEPEEPSGYCVHPFHSTWKSPHREYGGHWATRTSRCEMWEAIDVSDVR
jgi:hypothetical protein